MARAAAQRKELAIRTALGGGWLRLMRERLLESLLLSAAGGALGLLLAFAALQWLTRIRQDMSRVESIHIDGVVAAFSVGIIVLCALFFRIHRCFQQQYPQNIHLLFAYTWCMVMRSERRTNHRVLMSFMDRPGGWHVAFLEADCQTSLPVKLTFQSAEKIRIMQQRFGSSLLEDRQALDHGLSIGRGSVWLNLNAEQYERLKQQR